ncbi:DUF262 domain-containing protein [Natronococcus sp. A-GB1]|uniref:DUF262 domain-containing protein n=1 Tax=Natronococcus sp. A-GB1 TaxID=3037648 RepID=UPI00241C49FA|nr:DUF262 domain-containing protein [Natronococcus sp. A-GB1]MDG5761344.1 DUF262 domain-containing protein [Natronococcus sp. A-GB1]
MPNEPPTLFNTLIDYEQIGDIEVDTVSDYQVMNQITELNFNIDKKSVDEILINWRFEIPEYQRLFSWQERQHRQIWSDIQNFVDSELLSGQENVSDVFFGSMYFAVKGDDNTLEVIDGQQRLTTIYILLRTILEEFYRLRATNEFGNDTIERLCENSINQIEEILYETTVLGGQRTTLRLNKHDVEFFDVLIRGDEAQIEYLLSDDRTYIDGRKSEATKISSLIDEFDIDEDIVEAADPDEAVLSKFIPVYESNKNLLNAYNFYKDKIQGLIDQDDDPDRQIIALVNLNNYLQKSYYVGRFEIREAEPDFRMRVFEILNDRGLELTKIDRIRATVVNAFFEETDRDEYIGKWEDIVTAFGGTSNKIEGYLSVYLSIVEEQVSSTTDARSELINAFSTRNIDSDVTPRFNTLSTARSFLDKAEKYVPYYEDITKPQVEDNELNISSEYRDECQEILIRLDELGTSQWYPLILYTYYYTANDPEGDAEQFYRLLDTVEKLSTRRLLIDANPNVFANIFVNGTHQFKDGEDTEGENPYLQTRKFLVEEVQSNSSQLFADGFADIIAQSQSWDTTYTKLLFAKISNQQFRENVSSISRELEMDNIHLEHILPRNLVRGSGDATWPKEFFKTDSDAIEIVDEVEEYIELAQTDEAALSDEQLDRRDEIKEYLEQRFIDDIGNFLLLRDVDNLSASDRPLAEKMVQYYKDLSGFRDIPVNRYFTVENDDIDEDKLRQLITQAEAVDNGERDEIDQDLTDYFNSLWTYDTLQDRRVDLIIDLLDALSFDVLDDEFGLEENREDVRAYIREQTEDEFEKRLTMRSL